MYTVYIFKLEKLKLHIIKFLFGTSILMGASLILRSRKILLRKAALYPMLSRTQELGAIGFSVNAILRGHPPARLASKNMHPFQTHLIFFYLRLKWGISHTRRIYPSSSYSPIHSKISCIKYIYSVAFRKPFFRKIPHNRRK